MLKKLKNIELRKVLREMWQDFRGVPQPDELELFWVRVEAFLLPVWLWIFGSIALQVYRGEVEISWEAVLSHGSLLPYLVVLIYLRVIVYTWRRRVFPRLRREDVAKPLREARFVPPFK